MKYRRGGELGVGVVQNLGRCYLKLNVVINQGF